MEKEEVAAVRAKKFAPIAKAAQACEATQGKGKADSPAEDSAAVLLLLN